MIPECHSRRDAESSADIWHMARLYDTENINNNSRVLATWPNIDIDVGVKTFVLQVQLIPPAATPHQDCGDQRSVQQPSPLQLPRFDI